MNIAETFELLFDKNNNIAYKALQELQKESEKRDCVYPYMDRLSDMIAKYKPELKNDILSALHKADISVYNDNMQPLVYDDIQKALKVIQKL